MRPALKFCCLLTLSFLLGSLVAHAQELNVPAQESDETTEDSPSEKPWQAPEEVRSTAPDVYLLPDESGKLRKVLGFRYEDFFEAWQRDKNAVSATPPRYVLNDLNITGKVDQVHARLSIEFEIMIRSTGWIDIPIQLPEFIVQQLTIKNQTEGECLVFDKQRYGHVVWLSGQAGQKRSLVLEGLVKLRLSTGNQGMELHLPRATTSQFSLRVPASSSRFECSPELALTTTVPTIGLNNAVDEKTIEVRLLGQANPLQLNWTPDEEKASNQATLVEVEGETTVFLDRHRVSYTAKLKINSFEKPLEKIQVRLPLGAKLVASELSDEIEVQEIDSQEVNRGTVLAIRRKEGPLDELWELRLLAEQSVESLNNATECVVEGFEVVDAIRQTGTATLEISDQLQAYFETQGDIDQMAIQKTSTLSAGQSTLAQFRYARVPWSLAVSTSPRRRHISVKPIYKLTINSESAQLDVEYDYQLTGAQIFSLLINLEGWRLVDTPIESGGLIDTNGVMVREERLKLPLFDPSVQQLRLNLSFIKEIQLGENSFFLPEPLGASTVDGELLVNASEALQVIPNEIEMAGLSTITNFKESPLPSDTTAENQDSNQLHLRTFLSRPKFVAKITQRQLQLTSAELTSVEIDQQTIRVRQRIDYQAKYQPVSLLALSLPERLRSNNSLSITLVGEPLPFGLETATSEELPNGHGNNLPREEIRLRQVLVSLPRPMQNKIPIVISYELPSPSLVSDESTPLLLPLAVPRDPVNSNAAVVSAAKQVLVTTQQLSTSNTWTVDTELGAIDNSTVSLRLHTDEKPSFLSLYARLDSANEEQLATLERAWIQSWIAAGKRQERAVFRFRTAYEKVFCQLPAGFDNFEIEVMLNGDPCHYELLENDRLVVVLPVDKRRVSHTLEFRYQKTLPLPSWGKLKSSFPRLECHVASAPIYWQLILPRGWQIATSPKQLIPDYWLGWKNYRWGRQPTLTQAKLEQLTGALSGVAPTPMSTQYVFRAFDFPAEVQIVVIRQAWLFLAGSLVAFGIGLLWLYTSFARNGLFWLALALVAITGVFTYPEIALIATQTVLLGGLFVCVTSVLRQILRVNSSEVPLTANFPHHESSIETTEAWQHKSPLGNATSSETTATIRAGGTLP